MERRRISVPEKGSIKKKSIAGRLKKLVILFVLMLLACTVSACDPTADPTHGKEMALADNGLEDKKNGSFKIGVTYADMSNSVWAEEADAIENLAEEKGVDVIIMDCGNDASKQVNQIENFTSMGCDAIIIGATDPGTIDSAAKEAMESGVAVEAYGTAISYYTTTLLANNEGAGKKLAEAMAQDMQEKGIKDPQIAVVDYYGSTDCMERAEAFRQRISELLPDSRIVAEVSSATTDENMKNAENFIHSNPDLDGVFCIGDSAAVGVLQAIMTEGKEEDISVYSCDGSLNGISMMAEGAPLAADCSFGSGKSLGEQQLNLILKVLNNESYEVENRLSNTIVDKDNLEQMIISLGYEDQIKLTK